MKKLIIKTVGWISFLAFCGSMGWCIGWTIGTVIEINSRRPVFWDELELATFNYKKPDWATSEGKTLKKIVFLIKSKEEE